MPTLRNSIVGRCDLDDEKTLHPPVTINDIEPDRDNTPDYKRAAIDVKSEAQTEKYIWQTVHDERPWKGLQKLLIEQGLIFIEGEKRNRRGKNQ